MSKLQNVDRTGPTAGTQGRPTRKLRSDSIQTRRAILDATLRILRDHGLAELTHRAVAKEAGVSLALTSYHFSTKDNLISEALDLAATGDDGAGSSRPPATSPRGGRSSPPSWSRRGSATSRWDASATSSSPRSR